MENRGKSRSSTRVKFHYAYFTANRQNLIKNAVQLATACLSAASQIWRRSSLHHLEKIVSSSSFNCQHLAEKGLRSYDFNEDPSGSTTAGKEIFVVWKNGELTPT